jgi:hypothetical protein
VIIFGWGRRTFHHAGAVLFQRCSHCSNTGWFYLVTVRRWLTLFFIPVIPYEQHHMLLCPTCNRGVRLAGAELKRARSLIQLATLYTSTAINGNEYMRRLQESGIPLAAAAHPAPLSLAAAPPAASDGFGGGQVATQAAAPPPPSTPPPFRGTRMSRTAQIVRVLVPVVVIGLAAALWIYTSQNNNSSTQTTTSSFQTGDCITTPSGGTEIISVSCAGPHDGRIDEVLNVSATFCPPGDTELAVVPPNPDLCVDFNDHTPTS